MKVCSKCKKNEVKTKSTYCKPCHADYMREWYRDRNKTVEDIIMNRKYRMIASAKKRAKKADVDFNIAFSDIVIPDKCPVLGIKISMSNTKIRDDSPTLDRIIPQLGYVKGNIAVISCRANKIKTDADHREIRMVADWLESVTV